MTKRKIPVLDYPEILLQRLLADMPSFECNDFHHSKADQHKDYDCPPMRRFSLVLIAAKAYLAARTD